MMNMYYKWKGRNALRGNWQTAMVVAFFSGIFMVLTQVYQNRFMPVAIEMIDGMYYWRVPQITRGVWIGFAVLQLCSVLLTPVLSVGCNHYFVRRIEGEELGAKGLFSRMNLTGKALWLYVMMFVKIFLWTCLLIVPGFIAAIRYSMAPYFMAQDPSVSASEAIEQSKHAMKEMKMAYFSLIISFIGWSLLANVAQMFLMSFGVVIALVAAQFMQVAISAYMNAACASFFLTVSSENGMSSARRQMRDRLRQMGMDDSAIDRAGFGENPPHGDDTPGDGEGDGS